MILALSLLLGFQISYPILGFSKGQGWLCVRAAQHVPLHATHPNLLLAWGIIIHTLASKPPLWDMEPGPHLVLRHQCSGCAWSAMIQKRYNMVCQQDNAHPELSLHLQPSRPCLEALKHVECAAMCQSQMNNFQSISFWQLQVAILLFHAWCNYISSTSNSTYTSSYRSPCC